MKCEVCKEKINVHDSYETIVGKRIHRSCILERIVDVPDVDLPIKPEGSA